MKSYGRRGERTAEYAPALAGGSLPAPGDNQKQFLEYLSNTRVIAAVRSVDDLELAATSAPRIVDLLCGTPEDIGEMTRRLLDAGKFPVVNIDLLAGLARDASAVRFLVSRGIRGIISTHNEPLRAARSAGVVAIQRTFVIDSGALQSSMNSIASFTPDAVEALPAIAAPYLISRLRLKHAGIPILAGGLVESFSQIEYLIGKGVTAVSVSDSAFWVM